MQQATTRSVRRRSLGGRSAAWILPVALALVSSAACESSSPYPRPASDRARELLALIEECERTAGRDTERLQDCIPRSVSRPESAGAELDRQPQVLRIGKSTSPAIDALLEELASEAEDPVLRAAARYEVPVRISGAAAFKATPTIRQGKAAALPRHSGVQPAAGRPVRQDLARPAGQGPRGLKLRDVRTVYPGQRRITVQSFAVPCRRPESRRALYAPRDRIESAFPALRNRPRGRNSATSRSSIAANARSSPDFTRSWSRWLPRSSPPHARMQGMRTPSMFWR